MSYKEWTATVQLVGGMIIGLWLAMDAFGPGLGDGTQAGVAIHLLWAIGAVIAINVAGMVLISIVMTAVRQKSFEDEPADERDDMIDARSSRIGFTVTSLLAAFALIPVAMGSAPTVAIVMLFAAPLAGGMVHAAAQLAFYRFG